VIEAANPARGRAMRRTKRPLSADACFLYTLHNPNSKSCNGSLQWVQYYC